MSNTLALFGGTPIRIKPFHPWPVYDETEEKRLLRTLHSGQWGKLDGPEVAEFEHTFATVHGCRHGIGVVNGTVSLRIALLAAGIGAGDEVIVPAYTFLSTASAVVESNAVPVFVDLDFNTFNLDPKAVAAAVTPRTRAIIPVHFAGQPADMDAIRQIALQRNLVVIEDAAHAHGASLAGRSAGSLGDIASFSFQSSKNLTSGEGGILTTNNDHLAETCRSMHNCGRIPTGIWYEHHVISGNYRLGEFQAAILNCQLARLESQTRCRDLNGQYLAARLSQIPGLHPQKRPSDCTRHAYHLFMMRLDPREFGAPRGAVLKALHAEGIPCSGGYGFPLNQQPLFRNKAFGPYLSEAARSLDYASLSFPNSDRICREQGVWLDQRYFLGNRDVEVASISRTVSKGDRVPWNPSTNNHLPKRGGSSRKRSSLRLSETGYPVGSLLL